LAQAIWLKLFSNAAMRVPLTLSAVLLVGIVDSASWQAIRSLASQPPEEEVASCTCDCCLVVRGDAVGADNVKCVSRSGVGGASVDVGCPPMCGLAESARTVFQSLSGEVDYSRFCLAECRPGSTTMDDLCIESGSADDDSVGGGEASAAPAAAARFLVAKPAAPVEKAMTQLGAQVVQGETPAMGGAAVTSTDQSVSDTVAVLLGKAEMLRAQHGAEMAGRAAGEAKQNYLRILRSSGEMAEAASEATLREIKRQASQQAQEALAVRQKYEMQSQEKATQAALDAARVYRDARIRDAQLAATWNERAQQYATASSERQEMATGFSSQAQVYREQRDFDAAEQSILMAHQAVDQAAAFAASATAAHEQAAKIKQGAQWYHYAEQAAAANALAKSMPSDVRPPPVPALP